MPDPNRSPNSDNEKSKADGENKEENEKETETSEMYLDLPPMTHGAPMDVDDSSFIYVPDEDESDSNFESEYEMAAEVKEDLIQLDSDDAAANTTGKNIPHLPSVPSAPVVSTTQARGPTGTVSLHPLVPPSSTITIPPTQTRNSTGPHPLSPHLIFPIPSTQTRSSTGTDISRPVVPPSFATVAALPLEKGPTPSSPQLSAATRSITAWQRSLMSVSAEPTGPPPVYTVRPQPLCVVRNSQITHLSLSYVCL